MDTALKAMQRAARAVLKEELKATRARLRNETVGRINAEEAIRSLREQLTRSERERHQLHAERDEYRKRADQVVAWAEKNRPGETTLLACSQYMQQGATPLTYGAGGMRVNPFDRWQVTPAIR